MKLDIISFVLIYFFMTLTILGCHNPDHTIMPDKDLISVTDSAIRDLETKKVLFCHMSVGYNIIQGLDDLILDNERLNQLRISELKIDDDVKIDKPGIYHTKIGNNGEPKIKCDTFLKYLRKNDMGNKIDIAFFKFCYVDFNSESDVNNLFEYYVSTIAAVKEDFPRLKLIHVTTPLTAHAYGIKGFFKSLLKRDTPNIRRNQFNSLMLDKFKVGDQIFDVAAIESTFPSGARATFADQKSEYFHLIPSYSNDGGHLNQIGRFYAATEMLNVLTKLAINQ
jgi:hypothetical protein